MVGEAGGPQVSRGEGGAAAAAREGTDLQQGGADQDFLHALQVQVHLGGVEEVQDLLHGRVGHAVDQDLLLLRLTQAPGKHAPSGGPGDCSQSPEVHPLEAQTTGKHDRVLLNTVVSYQLHIKLHFSSNSRSQTLGHNSSFIQFNGSSVNFRTRATEDIKTTNEHERNAAVD